MRSQIGLSSLSKFNIKKNKIMTTQEEASSSDKLLVDLTPIEAEQVVGGFGYISEKADNICHYGPPAFKPVKNS